MSSESSKFALFGLCLALASPALGSEVFADEEATQTKVKALTQAVSDIRGLEVRTAIPVFVEDPATMRARMEKEIEKQLDPAAIEAMETTWKLLQLAPADFDVATSYASILESNVGGYFDVEEGRLVLVRRKMSGNPGMAKLLEDMVIAHELVHGLQDQHFNLWSLTRRELGNSDAALAISTLVEGDASYAMLYRMPIPLDPDNIPMDKMASMMAGAGGPSEDPGGALGKAPRIMQAPLIFPYVQGLVFIQHIKRPGDAWSSVDQAYAKPPLSTEQVLHPEKYGVDGDWPMDLSAPADRWLGGTQTLMDQDTFGELMSQLILEENVPEIDADAAVAGWDGDRYWTYHGPTGPSMVWRSTWDSEADAMEWETAATALVRHLSPNAELQPQPTGTWSSEGDVVSGVERIGEDVVVWIDVPQAKARKARRKALSVVGHVITRLDQLAPATDRPDAPPAPSTD
ncbi:MAG: hypothetical protein AB8H79_11590 [Myxococcota bacterium]